MLSYKDVKELKDAGFPQGKSHFHYEWWPAQDSWNLSCENDDQRMVNDCIFCPTLSELINACGEGFTSLERCDRRDCIKTHWIAVGFKKDRMVVADMETPEEAVKNLWLKLNKK